MNLYSILINSTHTHIPCISIACMNQLDLFHPTFHPANFEHSSHAPRDCFHITFYHRKVRKYRFIDEISSKWCEALSFNSFLPAKCGVSGSTRSDVKKWCLTPKSNPKDFVIKNFTPVKVQTLFQLSPVFSMPPSHHSIT